MCISNQRDPSEQNHGMGLSIGKVKIFLRCSHANNSTVAQITLYCNYSFVFLLPILGL